jgi:hypothetical protein
MASEAQKICIGCARELPLTEFGRRRADLHGSPICKLCNRDRSKASYDARKALNSPKKVPSQRRTDFWGITKDPYYYTCQQIACIFESFKRYDVCQGYTLEIVGYHDKSLKEKITLWYLVTVNKQKLLVVIFRNQVFPLPVDPRSVVKLLFRNGFTFASRPDGYGHHLPKLEGQATWKTLGLEISE